MLGGVPGDQRQGHRPRRRRRPGPGPPRPSRWAWAPTSPCSTCRCWQLRAGLDGARVSAGGEDHGLHCLQHRRDGCREADLVIGLGAHPRCEGPETDSNELVSGDQAGFGAGRHRESIRASCSPIPGRPRMTDPTFAVHRVRLLLCGQHAGCRASSTSTYALTNATLPYMRRGRGTRLAAGDLGRPRHRRRTEHPPRCGHQPAGGQGPRPQGSGPLFWSAELPVRSTEQSVRQADVAVSAGAGPVDRRPARPTVVRPVPHPG